MAEGSRPYLRRGHLRPCRAGTGLSLPRSRDPGGRTLCGFPRATGVDRSAQPEPAAPQRRRRSPGRRRRSPGDLVDLTYFNAGLRVQLKPAEPAAPSVADHIVGGGQGMRLGAAASPVADSGGPSRVRPIVTRPGGEIVRHRRVEALSRSPNPGACVRGPTASKNQCLLAAEFAFGHVA